MKVGFAILIRHLITFSRPASEVNLPAEYRKPLLFKNFSMHVDIAGGENYGEGLYSVIKMPTSLLFLLPLQDIQPQIRPYHLIP